MGRRHDSIPLLTSFLTDASVVAVIEAVGRLAGARVTLRDREGRRVVRLADPAQRWRVALPDHFSPLVRAAIEQHQPAASSMGFQPMVLEVVLGSDVHPVIPIEIDHHIAGAFCIESRHWDGGAATSRTTKAILQRLAGVIDEFCAREIVLNDRNAELSLLYRLSSLMTAARDVQAAAAAVIELASQHFQAGAAAIHLVSSNRRSLELCAQRGLDGWQGRLSRFELKNSAGASADELIRTGEAAFSQVKTESGMAGSLAVGLLFQGDAFGVLRLFTAEDAALDQAHRSLLQTIAEQASEALGRSLVVESERRNRRQVKLAADVQQRMLPAALPQLRGLDVFARYLPSLDVGGDFYDLFELDGRLAVVVADVVGKGVPAGLLMASVRASLRAHAGRGRGVEEVVALVNRDMCRDTLGNEFATLFFATIDPRTLLCRYCNAGHEPPLIAGPTANEKTGVRRLEVSGMVVGVIPEETYTAAEIELAPGETLVAVTDGVIEAMDFDGRKFGRDRLAASLQTALQAETPAAKGFVDQIVWDIRRFIGLNPRSDDTTIVAVQVQR